MFKNFAALAIFIIAASASAKAPAGDMQLKYSLEQLQQVAGYLTLRMKSTAPLLPCDPDAAQARNWMGSTLHDLIEDKIADEVDLYLKNPKKYLRRIKNCAAACTCDGYGKVVGKADAELADDPIHKKISAQLDRESKKQDPMACAKTLTWYCASELRAYLGGEREK